MPMRTPRGSAANRRPARRNGFRQRSTRRTKARQSRRNCRRRSGTRPARDVAMAERLKTARGFFVAAVYAERGGYALSRVYGVRISMDDAVAIPQFKTVVRLSRDAVQAVMEDFDGELDGFGVGRRINDFNELEMAVAYEIAPHKRLPVQFRRECARSFSVRLCVSLSRQRPKDRSRRCA